MSGDLLFVGVAHPPQEEKLANFDLVPNDFCDSNLKQMNLTGLPILVKHYREEAPVGHIINSVTGDLGNSKTIVGIIDKSHENIIKSIEEGIFPELSLTHKFKASINEKGNEVQTRTPIEVSLTEKGNRPGCNIILSHRLKDTTSSGSQIRPQTILSQKEKKEVFTLPNMTSNIIPPGTMGVPTPQGQQTQQTQPDQAQQAQQGQAQAQQGQQGQAQQAQAQAQQGQAQSTTNATNSSTIPPAYDMAFFSDPDNVQKMGWSPEELLRNFAVASQAAEKLKKQNETLQQEFDTMKRTSQQNIVTKAQKYIDLLKADGITQEQGEMFMKYYGNSNTIEEADNKGQILEIELANKVENNEMIKRQNEELQMWRTQMRAPPKPTNTSATDYMAMVSNLTSSSNTETQEPLGHPTKRFASQAFGNVFSPPPPQPQHPQQQQRAPTQTFEELCAAFSQTNTDPPQVGTG